MRSVYFRLINNSWLKFTYIPCKQTCILCIAYKYECEFSKINYNIIQYMVRSPRVMKTRRRLLSLWQIDLFWVGLCLPFLLYFLDLLMLYTQVNHSTAHDVRCVYFVRNSTTNSIDSKRLSILIKFLVTNLPFSFNVFFSSFFGTSFLLLFLLFFPSFCSFGYVIRT